jgi:hypothetical protein
MKNKQEIMDKIENCIIHMEACQLKYKTLNQIDMLSEEGSTLRERINKYKGKIEALKWVLL